MNRSCSSFILILSLCQITSGVVYILNHQLQPSSHASSPTFFARDPTVASAQKSRQLAGRDPYGTYFPADITEPFVKKNRCPYPAKQSREIPGVEMFDDMFSQILRFYDDRKHLHHKSKFMGIRMGQFPFDLQVMTEILYDVKPDLVIETGTNAGGFSVYLATLLTAWNPNATILTVDSQPLKKWQQRFGGDLFQHPRFPRDSKKDGFCCRESDGYS